MEFKWRLIDQLDQPAGGTLSQCQFGRAFGFADLRGIDIGDTDFCASDPELISVDDTERPVATLTFAEASLRYFCPCERFGHRSPSRDCRNDYRRDGDGNNGPCDVVSVSAFGVSLAALKCHAARSTMLEATAKYYRLAFDELLIDIGLVEYPRWRF